VPGAGADELIRLVTTQAVGAGDAVVVPTPTFAMFAVEARLAGARVVDVPRRRSGMSPGAGRRSARRPRRRRPGSSGSARRTIRPATPTPLDEIRAVAEQLPAIVCVDEVYAEFGEDAMNVTPGSSSAIRLQAELSNVLVLRSLSKAYALAGARVGYLVVPDGLAERFDAAGCRSRSPLRPRPRRWPPSRDDEAHASGDAAPRRTRRLANAARGLGCRTLPSVTNFVAFRPRSRLDAAERGRGAARPGRGRAPLRLRPDGRVAARHGPTGLRGGAAADRAAGGARMSRVGAQERATAETTIRVRIDLDGSGEASISTPIGFLDHLLTLFARHALVDLEVEATGDVHIDEHHTVEDTALVLGRAIDEALGERSASAATATSGCRWTRRWRCARSISAVAGSATSSRCPIR
jgi:hypothetical protein